MKNEEELAKIRASDNTSRKAITTTRSSTPTASSLTDNAGDTPTAKTTVKLPIHSTRTVTAAAATITITPVTLEMLMQEVRSLMTDLSQLRSPFDRCKRAHSVSCRGELDQLKSELRQLRSDFDAYRLAHTEPPVQWPTTAAPVTTTPPPVPVINITKTVLADVHKEMSDKQKNVVVSGLKPPADVSDTDLFLNICTDHLNVKPVVIFETNVYSSDVHNMAEFNR